MYLHKVFIHTISRKAAKQIKKYNPKYFSGNSFKIVFTNYEHIKLNIDEQASKLKSAIWWFGQKKQSKIPS